jgi:AmmeMemoRadiSam system protein A
MSSLASCEKRSLLDVARRALTLGVRTRETLLELPSGQAFDQPGGAFVTLHKRARLRGCIGQLPSREPLVRVVAHCARSAGLEDPRFEPVDPRELAEIEIELSVLSILEDVTSEKIVAGKHGLVVSNGAFRGVLLPQVAAQFRWSSVRFLEETCLKAGLGREAWKDCATRIQAFTADVFSESEFNAGEKQRPAF